MNFVILSTFLVQTILCFPPFGFPNDATKSLYDVTSGVVRKLPDTLPSLDAIFSTSKNIVAGYPIEAMLGAIHHFCEFEQKKKYNSST